MSSDGHHPPFSFAELDREPTHRAAVAVAAAADEDVLQAVYTARERGLIEPILVGERNAIERVAAAGEIDLSGMTIESVGGEAASAAQRAVELVAAGEASTLMKGMVDTGVLMREVLKREYGLRGEGVLSHVALFQIAGYGRPLALTDAAVNIAPDLETKRAIITNAVSVLHRLGYAMPLVAIIAASERVAPAMPATVEAQELVSAWQRGELPGCIVAGPLALDNAVSPEAARIKGIESPVAGHADVLMVPTIESGNVLYKALAFLTSARHAGLIVGARVPIVLTSRADSPRSKVDSLALAAYAAGGHQKRA
ncbi:MAG TPA: bifunctional enoyl-CoA hydratase/phosphate acetyltransferase [Alkalispirochaeta sp.]|nr:bifunctional enoyl-CoA hydratase/phosphate acetyltransferase [Alkalispirochaeta sp.]